MRIVGGALRGRALKGPASQAVRPTSDRLRETIFNILQHSYDDPVRGARVLDLFAGTGAMAIEALSRGARYGLLVDTNTEARSVILANIDALGLGDVAAFLRRDATKLGRVPEGEPFRLVFLDPPYGRSLVGPALEGLRDGHWLARDALAVIEEARQATIVLPETYTLIEARDFGDTKVLFARAA